MVVSGTTFAFGDPMNFDNELADSDSAGLTRRNPQKNNAATGASAAGVRALSAQLIAFYFRAPVKAFFRTRVEYATSSFFRQTTAIDMFS